MIAMLEEAEDVLRRAGCDMTADRVRGVLQAQQAEPVAYDRALIIEMLNRYCECVDARTHESGKVISQMDLLARAAQQPAVAAPQAASESPVQWPQERDVGRIGDMSQVASLRVGLDADSDVYVCIHGEAGSGSVEFCVPGSGGGASPRTRAALIGLMVAMEADNAETPSRDWWKAREGDEQKGGA